MKRKIDFRPKSNFCAVFFAASKTATKCVAVLNILKKVPRTLKIDQKTHFNSINTLREFRKKAKPGQEAMAELLHTTRSLLSITELGHRSLPEASMERLKMFQAAG